MRRLLLLVLVIGLFVSVGCKEEKTVAPKETPPPPKGPPTGSKSGAGAGGKTNNDNKNKAQGAPVSP